MHERMHGDTTAGSVEGEVVDARTRQFQGRHRGLKTGRPRDDSRQPNARASVVTQPRFRPPKCGTVGAVSTPVTDEALVSPESALASGLATLSDATIRKVRIGLMLWSGVAGLTLAIVQLLVMRSYYDDPWLRINGFAFMGTAAVSLGSLALNWTPWLRASELLMLLAAYVGTASVVVTGGPPSFMIVGIVAFGVLILVPGIALRPRSLHTSAINLFGVCVVYFATVMLRMSLHDDGMIENNSILILYLTAPPLGYVAVWFMVRVLNRRILEALAESERARNALRGALDHQVTLNQALARFVPQEFLTSLGRHDISEVRLGDSVTRTMSILFADIYGYTKLVEGMTPAATIDLLNDLFGALEPAIEAHHGFVDSYIGDAIMALFDGSPRSAIDAALAMLTALRRHNEVRGAAGLAPIAIGIGINTGIVTLGTNGGTKRLKCSVFGDSVNLAARIEHLTRRYGAPLLVSEHTLELAEDLRGYDVRAVDRVQVVGRSNPTTLFEIYDADPEPLRSRKRLIDAEYSAGVAAFYDRRFTAALAAFERCLASHDDAVVRSFVERSRAAVMSPPDDAWTGIEVQNQK